MVSKAASAPEETCAKSFIFNSTVNRCYAKGQNCKLCSLFNKVSATFITVALSTGEKQICLLTPVKPKGTDLSHLKAKVRWR